jgi:hypothetical protein
MAVNDSRIMYESFSIYGQVKFSDNKFIYKYKLHGGFSILQINMPVDYIHTIVIAKGV